MPMAEARLLLRELTEHATQPKFVYAHRWRPWDLIMWDNRQMMHRVRRYDERQPRDMCAPTIAGEVTLAGQVAAAQRVSATRAWDQLDQGCSLGLK